MESISELIGKIHNQDNYWLDFGNWLDDVWIRNLCTNATLQNEPEWFNMAAEQRAFFAGVAHHIAKAKNLDVPEWVYKDQYFLDEPYFSLNAKGKLQLALLAESPQEFRVRNIFISANTLDRV